MSVYIPIHKTIEELRNFLIFQNHTLGISYQKIADHYGVNVGTVHQVANKSHEPIKHNIRRALGLPLVALVRAINGEIKPGAQALASLDCVKCGAAFVPNHWRRGKCFDCSPKRKKK